MSLIKKAHIANGIFWVEVPEADLRICCGVPPDTVKFLKKKNYIRSSPQSGKEVGPNAILLSDAMVQNHMLCNLGEFPVMQMLYMQGMINDPEKKPMIIGLENVVLNQLEYIKRGNYGMLNMDEIAEVHHNSELSPEMIHSIKKYFAEGKFLDTNTLCEAICLYQYERCHIKQNVYISRIDFNVFSIDYKNESVIIDLNLTHYSHYEIPYSLEDRDFKFNSFSVLHAGEGNGWHPGQPCMGSVLINNDKLYCIDCGPNLVNNLLKLGIDIQDLEGIFLTHIHDDHFAGMADLFKSTKKLKFYTTPLVRSTVEKKFAALLGLGINVFRDFFEVTDLNFDQWNIVNDFEVKPIFSPHPVETNVFLFRKQNGEGNYLRYNHLADTISFKEMKLIRKSDYHSDQLESVFNKIKSAYLEKAEVKKVDVGGGKIHGVSQDYQNDESDKIIFSHIDQPYYKEGRKIVKENCFGKQDILIDDEEEHNLHDILENVLVDIYPEFDDSKLVKEVIRKGTFMKIKEEEISYDDQDILIVLNGCLGSHHVRFGKRIIYVRGNLIGLYDAEVYEATGYHLVSSFANLFKINKQSFLKIVRKFNTYLKVEERRDLLKHLVNSKLFSRGFNTSMLVKLTCMAKWENVQQKFEMDQQDLTDLFVVASGTAYAVQNDKKVFGFGKGDFFGGNELLDDGKINYTIQIKEHIELIRIDCDEAKKYPLIGWQLFENCSLHNHLCNIGIYING